jgi:hypothetical protein
MTQLDWETSSFNEAQKASIATPRLLAVSDGHVCSVAFVPRGMSIRAALDDYARGYDGGAEGISVTWKLFAHGYEDNQGRRQF